DITRMERALDRERLEDKPCVAELCRRYLADEEDFSTERLNEAGIGSGISNITIEEAIAAIEKKIFCK
ncbi:MAG: guanylate kinase, partial [Eubacterium sp.]|nr:guanylate kinase [Eubacterium sp.]